MMWRSGDKFDPISQITFVRYFWCEVLQAIQATLIYFLCKTLIFPLAPSITFVDSVCNFLVFLSHLQYFNVCFLYYVPFPSPIDRLSPLEYLHGLLKLIFVKNIEHKSLTIRRVACTTKVVILVATCGLSAFYAFLSITASSIVFKGAYAALGLRGLAAGLIYAFHYRTWVLEFPIIQRAPFFSYKLGVPKAIIEAVKLSTSAYFLTLVPSLLANYCVYKGQPAIWDLIMEQIVFYVGCAVVFLCWELNRNIVQVILTQRLVFSPPRGSVAAALNPSYYHLLAALEDTKSIVHVRYLSYYDLLLFSESNCDAWRRVAFYEETGVYTRVISVCLKPLEKLITDLTSSRLNNVPFYDFQILGWCARIASSLTVRTEKEDRRGDVQFYTNSIEVVISTLLSTLLAVEESMGKTTNLVQSTYQYLTLSHYKYLRSKRSDTNITSLNKKDNGDHYSKAYYMADILRTSIYQIVSVFHQQMVDSSKAGGLYKDWIARCEPLYGSRDHLVQKLRLFIELQAN